MQLTRRVNLIIIIIIEQTQHMYFSGNPMLVDIKGKFVIHKFVHLLSYITWNSFIWLNTVPKNMNTNDFS